jgi:peptidoglycan/xylan/chitin deacetylase (PgdA/CDA1 family)
VIEGHEIGAHGWSHRDHRDHPLAGAREVACTAALIASVCGVEPRLFRPPFGFTNRRLRLAVARHRLRTLLWDVDPRDYEEPGARTIYDRVVAAIARARSSCSMTTGRSSRQPPKRSTACWMSFGAGTGMP